MGMYGHASHAPDVSDAVMDALLCTESYDFDLQLHLCLCL